MIFELRSALAKLDPPLLDEVDEAVPLSEYAWKFRYPGELFEPPASEVEDAMEICRRVIAAVQSRLPAEAAPKQRASDDN